MTIRPAQRRAAAAALALAAAVAVGLVACSAPDAPSGPGGGTGSGPSTSLGSSSTTSTTGAPGGSSTTVAGGGGASSTTAPSGGSSTTSAPVTSVPVTTSVPPSTTTTTWPAADVSIQPSVVSVVTNPGFGFVKVYWNNQTANQLVYVDVCARPTSSPGFSTGLDCAPLSEVNVNGTADGRGVVDLAVFRGPEPSGDLKWGCFAPGDVAPAGILKLTTCYVRVTTGSLANSAGAREAPFTLG